MSAVAVFIARRYEIGWLQQLVWTIFGIGGQQQAENNTAGAGAHETEPEGAAADIVVPPEGSRAIDIEGSSVTDNGPPPSSSSTLADLLRIPQSPLSSIESDSDEIVQWR